MKALRIGLALLLQPTLALAQEPTVQQELKDLRQRVAELEDHQAKTS